jgi:hypothetical protein
VPGCIFFPGVWGLPLLINTGIEISGCHILPQKTKVQCPGVLPIPLNLEPFLFAESAKGGEGGEHDCLQVLPAEYFYLKSMGANSDR